MAIDVVTYALCKKYADKISATLIGGLKYMGSKATVSDLPPASESIKGHLYTITENGHEYVCDGTQWINLSADLDNKQDKITDLEDIRSGAALGATSIQPNDNVSSLTNDANYITAAALNGYVLESEATPVIANAYIDDEDDAARANWGGGWRYPTYDELNELWNLPWTFTEEALGLEGRDGYETITANGHSIILPATGYRQQNIDGDYVQYPSSSLSSDNERCQGKCAYAELWRGNNTSHNKYPADIRRYLGCYVRPVLDKGADANGHNAVDLGLSVLWADRNLGATNPKDRGLKYAWGETTPKDTYTLENYKYHNGTIYTKYVTNTQYGLPDSFNVLRVNKFIPKSDIVNNLISEDTGKVLSAKQGKVLKDLIESSSYTVTLDI